MKEKRVIPIWASVIFMILIIASAIKCVMFMPAGAFLGENTMLIIVKSVEMVTFFFAFVYCVIGYGKNASVFYKLFTLFYALFGIFALYGKYVYITPGIMPALSMAVGTVPVILVLELGFIKNLGKRVSLILASGVILTEALGALFAVGKDTDYLIVLIGRVVLAVILLIAVLAKYSDKSHRGTK